MHNTGWCCLNGYTQALHHCHCRSYSAQKYTSLSAHPPPSQEIACMHACTHTHTHTHTHTYNLHREIHTHKPSMYVCMHAYLYNRDALFLINSGIYNRGLSK